MSIILFFMALQMISEFLPISSSSHLFLTGYCLHYFFHHPIISSLPENLDHFLHIQTAIVLLIYFWNSWVPFLKAFFYFYSNRKTYVRLRKIGIHIFIFT